MKTKFLNLLVVIIFNLSPVALMAGNSVVTGESPVSRVTGKILDQSTGNPVEYVSVALYKSTDSSLVTGTITDMEGYFTIEKVDTGNYYLKTSFIGYSDQFTNNIRISKKSNSANLGSINIASTATEINEVVVAGEAKRVEYKIDKRVVNVDKDISAKGGTAVSVLENTPSVQVDPEGNLTLRGSSDYVVLIDGKPSITKGSDALKQIPSNAIKQIEVITNPSAKYDAEGQAGIINIIMKKEKMQGVNGNFSAGYGNNDKSNANALINYRKNKLNYFAGVDYTDNTYNGDLDIISKTILTDETLSYSEKSNQFNNNYNLTFKGGIDYDPNEKNTFSLSGSIGSQGYDHGSNARYNKQSSLGTSSYNTSSNYMDVAGDVIGINFDYTHKFADNHKITLSYSYSSWDGLDSNNLVENTTNMNYQEENLLSKLYFTKDNYNFQNRANIDYSRPLGTGIFETGVQFRSEYRTEDFAFKNFDLDSNIWINNDSLSYNLDYLNTIYSGYATYSDKIWGIGYQIGLRSEYFMRSIDISNEDGTIEYNKFMFYPSVHLSKEFNEKQQMQASYSRRINRPQPWLLNNTPSYVDPMNIFMGSPYLKPEYTDAFELNYRAIVKKFTFSVQTYYRLTTNSFTALRDMNDDGIMYHRLVNAKNNKACGAELGVDVILFKWWQISSGANLYNYQLKTLVSNTDKVQKVNTMDARLVSNFSLKWGTRIQAIGYYRAPSVDAMGEITDFFIANLAISQPVLKGKGNISVSGQNLLPRDFVYSVKTNKFDNKYTMKVRQ
jgi:outer membrane receptor protein involved in Fe transport